jgi:hypothetical protein
VLPLPGVFCFAKTLPSPSSGGRRESQNIDMAAVGGHPKISPSERMLQRDADPMASWVATLGEETLGAETPAWGDSRRAALPRPSSVPIAMPLFSRKVQPAFDRPIVDVRAMPGFCREFF